MKKTSERIVRLVFSQEEILSALREAYGVPDTKDGWTVSTWIQQVPVSYDNYGQTRPQLPEVQVTFTLVKNE